MKTLISNTAFGKLCKSKEKEFKTRLEYLEWYEKARNSFDAFLSLTPEIWMFVACKLIDGVWVVLEEPTLDWLRKNCINKNGWDSEEIRDLQDEYQTAKERCYFEGFSIGRFTGSKDNHFEYIDNEKGNFRIFVKDVGIGNWEITKSSIKTLEDLTPYNLTLTATAQKEIGL